MKRLPRDGKTGWTADATHMYVNMRCRKSSHTFSCVMSNTHISRTVSHHGKYERDVEEPLGRPNVSDMSKQFSKPRTLSGADISVHVQRRLIRQYRRRVYAGLRSRLAVPAANLLRADVL